MGKSETDLRGFLSYVPQFRGKLFVVDFEWSSLSEAERAEIVLDLNALQSIGVKLILVSSAAELEDFLDWAVDHEFRAAMLLGNAAVRQVLEVVDRGQAALVSRKGGLLSEKLIEGAVEAGAAKIIVLGDIEAIKKEGEQVKFLRVSEIEAISDYLTVRARVILDKAAEACSRGVERVHILEAGVPGALLNELFSNEGVGTMVYTDVYRQIRMLREEDVSELLGIIGRSVRRTHLVPRSYEQIAASLQDYAVMEVDGYVVGCVALYSYGEVGEIACLYVKESHEGTGYGADLVNYVENLAKERQLTKLFALTNRAAHFFSEHLSYQVMQLNELPVERFEQLQESGRHSQAFVKQISAPSG